jgi:hypothetical protein
MTFGVVVDMPAPVEMYDALHQELLRTVPQPTEGLLLHLGRATDQGFQVIEVWDSRDSYDRYNREVVWPLAARMAGDQPPPSAAPTEQTFEVRGLLIPEGTIAF